MTETLTLTSQTRHPFDSIQGSILAEYASLHNHVEHSLYAEAARGKAIDKCKSDFLKQFGITARQFNACSVSLKGKIAACREAQKQTIFYLKQKIEHISGQIKHLEKKASKQLAVHQKKRRKEIYIKRLEKAEKDHQQNRIHICFGGKKLFRAQFQLEKNGFNSHQEWKETWEKERNSEFFVLGSKDEAAGNQTCQAHLQENGKFTLTLRLPNALVEKHGKYLRVKDVSFSHGHELICSSLCDKKALSYRFKKDQKGWRIFVSTDLKKPETASKEGIGVIGIDLNTDHIACVETDRFGNPISKKVFPWNSFGKTKEQLKAATGDICKQIVALAEEAKKPIVIEKLDFQKKKMALQGKFARLLSGFAYRLFYVFLTSRAFKNGIALHQVNPAYTSIIGQVNYATRYGLSTHLAAALCIARRYQKFSESPCSSIRKIPDGKGGHVAFVLPERNRTKHVWSFWGQVKKKIKTAHAAYYRAKYRSRSPNSTPETVPS